MAVKFANLVQLCQQGVNCSDRHAAFDLQPEPKKLELWCSSVMQTWVKVEELDINVGNPSFAETSAVVSASEFSPEITASLISALCLLLSHMKTKSCSPVVASCQILMSLFAFRIIVVDHSHWFPRTVSSSSFMPSHTKTGSSRRLSPDSPPSLFGHVPVCWAHAGTPHSHPCVVHSRGRLGD